ncbi:MAG TPA: methylated-DNA--[protein]-cysteine S-methyltransferase [Victivallales bacterium]|nr:methylated-DNA--[protein]-cysteine S-methyltransferase [Victivallales bacterium]
MKDKQLPDFDIMYKALINKDSSFEGIFFVGVKTTGIFCRPTCTARKPKKENVEFFSTSKEALDYGYRPCRMCHPMEMYGTIPEWLQPLMKEIEGNQGIKLKDYDLRNRNLEPARVRRWFKKHHNMTFQAYLRSLRINRAFGQIKHNEKIISPAYENSFDSLSGFNSAFKKVAGFNPSESCDKKIINITRLLTPIGPMFVAATDKGVCLLEFTDRRMLETEIKQLKKFFNAEFVPGENKYFKTLNKQLSEYFAGTRKSFDIPLITPGTDFQKKVWNALQKIPYGETRSYQEQAVNINKPKAVRAVASANGCNKIAIIIPCHRVIAKDGTLAGYGGGIWRKQYLLDLEAL